MHLKQDLMALDQELPEAALLSVISGRCVAVATEEVDSAIGECQRSICEHLAVDHSELWQADDEPGDSLLLTHFHRRSYGQPKQARRNSPWSSSRGVDRQDLPLRTDAKPFFPWIVVRARVGETVVISSLDELPPEAARDREMLTREGIGSMVVLPLASGERWLGMLAFGMGGESRAWKEGELKAFRLTGDMFANALARMRTDRALVETELRANLISAAAEADPWVLDFASGEMELGERGRKMLNPKQEEPYHYENYLARVHLEDRQRVRAALHQACQSGAEVSLEYRIEIAGGKLRWLNARCHPVVTVPGATTRVLGASVDVTELREAQEQLRKAAAEIRELKERVKSDGEYLRAEVKVNQRHNAVVGQSRGIRKVLQQVEQVAPVSCPVLISGESGTGKELIAQSIHRLSSRGGRAMVTVNCAALPAGLIESELFGRERGAFTGALSSQAGLFEVADESTIFLDEVAELPLELQGKMLRVLQEGEYARLGNPKTRKVDVRVIAATNRNLGEEVRKGRFREDLFYRLNVFPIHLPPLRDRSEDIPLLVIAFMEELSAKMGKRISKVPRRVMETLQRHFWPGNIRELRNAIERGVIVSSGDTLRISLAANAPAAHQAVTLAEVERQHILATLEKTDWHIKGPHGAAKILEMKPGTLYSRMRKLGVPHKRQKDGMPT